MRRRYSKLRRRFRRMKVRYITRFRRARRSRRRRTRRRATQPKFLTMRWFKKNWVMLLVGAVAAYFISPKAKTFLDEKILSHLKK